jgi:hypothetical protein
MRSRTSRTPAGRPSVGPAVLLMALGGIIAFGGLRTPAAVEKYVDMLDLGLILVWSGILLLVRKVVMHRPRRARRRPAYDDRTDEWYDNDVHRPGYADRTDALPTARGDRRR